ncbi:MAG TPA: cysteine--tRNA ligase [Bryobacteraceae bacterium]|jgi:cysteinyl-tRNA synthetase
MDLRSALSGTGFSLWTSHCYDKNIPAMALRFYNTLTQKSEPFTPLHDNVVRMYTCGPTVYNYVHIGNLRAFTFQDILRRVLKSHGYTLDHVMNITDVEDKIIRDAAAANKTIFEFTEIYTKGFLEDTAMLRLQRPERMVKATDHIDDMASAIETLEQKGFTYRSDGSVYYRIANFPTYGKLSHNDFTGIRAGARVDVDEYDKDDARDFVLWKAQKDGEPAWETPLGPGRPGWHIECSVMAMKYLGETLDIHTGGVDLTFPHHENEIAQSEAITGKPFARFWLHSEHLSVDGQKMSKSLGNFYTLRDLVAKGYAPESVRYLLASVPYRKKLNFTFDGLKAAATSIDRLRNFKLRLEAGKFPEGVNAALADRTSAAAHAFEEALDDDLNTAEALGTVFEFVRDANTAMDAGEFLAGNASVALNFLAKFDAVFDVLKPTEKSGGLGDPEIQALVDERHAAKKARNFARADEIRKQLAEQGIVLEDTKEGVRWKRQ